MELPRLEPIWESGKDKGVSVIAIEGRRDTQRAKDFISEHGLTFHFLEASENGPDVVKDLYRVRAFPTSFILDGKGKILYYHLGFEAGDEETIQKEIDSILNQS
ncbi:MAG TPA: TlpA disulfide reductase family protein [Thermoanaerobaculia bacterium]|nr:TlpA disulfide reductase family protein [Thermoanaerobaculia bacterium]HUM29482.1 TlpA disulfide reductase family protein [Thermoanaerobaculia bacterium]HXK67865.1 TlpA disulfide reductase family protein [Thermoanaerobaculia bacterium]